MFNDDDFEEHSDGMDIHRKGMKRINDLSSKVKLPQTSDSSIPLLGGRPERDACITKDEIIGLVIDLETLSPEDLNYRYFGVAA
jgi:hypothetical protein